MAGRFRGPPRLERVVFDCAWSAFQRRTHPFLAAAATEKMEAGASRQARQRLLAIAALGEAKVPQATTDQVQGFRIPMDFRGWRPPVRTPLPQGQTLLLEVKLNGPFVVRGEPAAGYWDPRRSALGVTTTIPETIVSVSDVEDARHDLGATVRHEVTHVAQCLLSGEFDVGAPQGGGFREELDLEYHPWVQDLAFEIRRHTAGLPPADVRRAGALLIRKDRWLRMLKRQNHQLWRKAIGELGGLVESLAMDAAPAAVG